MGAWGWGRECESMGWGKEGGSECRVHVEFVFTPYTQHLSPSAASSQPFLMYYNH